MTKDKDAKKVLLPHGGANEWDWSTCNHNWIISGDGELGDVPGCGPREEVTCSICGCPGERFISTGEVEWPTT